MSSNFDTDEKVTPPPSGTQSHISLGVMAFEHITVDPGQMGGRPCRHGLRVTVAKVLRSESSPVARPSMGPSPSTRASGV